MAYRTLYTSRLYREITNLVHTTYLLKWDSYINKLGDSL
jgi:hypothetical protein